MHCAGDGDVNGGAGGAAGDHGEDGIASAARCVGGVGLVYVHGIPSLCKMQRCRFWGDLIFGLAVFLHGGSRAQSVAVHPVRGPRA